MCVVVKLSFLHVNSSFFLFLIAVACHTCVYHPASFASTCETNNWRVFWVVLGGQRSRCKSLRWGLCFVVANLTLIKRYRAIITFVPLNSLTFPRPPPLPPAECQPPNHGAEFNQACRRPHPPLNPPTSKSPLSLSI